MQEGYYSTGRFWSRNRAWRLRKTVFGAVAQRAILSGLTTLFLTEKQELRLDRVLVGFARNLLRGDARAKAAVLDADGEHLVDDSGQAVVRYRALADDCLWQSWYRSVLGRAAGLTSSRL